jgi:hypothetical protein
MCQHTGQRPHPCTACRKSFLTPVRLRRHWARRHNNPLDSGNMLENDTGKPLENDNGKPLENDNGKPLENDNGKPLENDNGKPLEKNDNGKPLENVNPLDNDMPLAIVNLLENGNTLANDKPLETDNQVDNGTPIDHEIRLDYDFTVSPLGVTTSLSILECEIIGVVEGAGVCFSLPCYNQGEAVVF